MSKKGWIIFIVAIVVLLGGLVAYSRSNSTTIDVSNVDATTVLSASESSGNIADHVYGQADSKVILIEYGDFQCPGCASINPGLMDIVKEYQDRIAFVFRNFPLTDAHPNAKAAAAAAEAAGLQGKYWEMHEELYSNQSAWENLSVSERTDYFKIKAEELSLDQDQFVADMASSAVTQKINFDRQLGIAVDVNATPTMYLNGEKLGGDISQSVQSSDGQALKDALDAALAQ